MANEEKIEEKPVLDFIKSARFRKTNQLAKQLAKDITRSLSGYKKGEELTPDTIRELGNTINQINSLLETGKLKLSSTRVKELTSSRDFAISILELKVKKISNAIKELKGSIDQNGSLTQNQLNELQKTLSVIRNINPNILPENLSKEITAANNTSIDILAEQSAKNTTRLLSEYKKVDELTPDQINKLEGDINAINAIINILEIEEISPTRVQQLTDIRDSAVSTLEKDKINKLAGEINENTTRSLSEYKKVDQLTPDQINKLGDNINRIDFILGDKRLSPTRRKQLTKSKELAINTLTLEVKKLSNAVKNLNTSINENRSLTKDQLKELLIILPIIVNINTHILPKNLSKEITVANNTGTAILKKVVAASKKKTQEKTQEKTKKERQGRRQGRRR